MNSSHHSIGVSAISSLAQLSSLSLTDEESASISEELTETLRIIDVLKEVDTQNVTFPPQITGLTNVFREDIIQPSLSHEEILSGVRRTWEGYVVVDSVLPSDL